MAYNNCLFLLRLRVYDCYMTDSPRVITKQDDLNAFCEDVAGAPYLAVDTEFLRDSTFWPKLCLIQAATPEHAAAIDPLADGLDLAPFLRLMADQATVKVFHAARQDLEIFFQLMDEAPLPVFDTQVAAMVCGFGDSIGYDKLVAALARVQIDKGSRFTNWAQRPLTPQQLSYALSDVTHLCVVYERLTSMLQSRGRLDWAEEEQGALVDPTLYANDPDEAWRRLKIRNEKPKFLNVLQAAAAWREREAMRRDQPRNWVVRDDALLNIAVQTPVDEQALSKCRGIAKGFASSRGGRELLEALNEARERPASDAPKAKQRRHPDPELQPTVELLRVLLKRAAERHGVAQRLVASTDDLETIAAGEDAPALNGWRLKVFGEEALKLIDGRLALAVKDRKVSVFEVDPDQATTD